MANAAPLSSHRPFADGKTRRCIELSIDASAILINIQVLHQLTWLNLNHIFLLALIGSWWSGQCLALEAGKVEFRQCSNVGGVWEMTSEGQVKQGNMRLALGGPGVVAMHYEEAGGVGAGSFFPVAVPKYDPRQACASKAEACHLQDQSISLGSGKPATSAAAFSSDHAVGGTRLIGESAKALAARQQNDCNCCSKCAHV